MTYMYLLLCCQVLQSLNLIQKAKTEAGGSGTTMKILSMMMKMRFGSKLTLLATLQYLSTKTKHPSHLHQC
ncbi:unnamed protein product [Cuscuta campestris]|uniref:Uncharacterized protein n=1 Tax=Cuscuta campestris TaxID=132261 RepID=A0A484M8U4_9ASTE|nr:unnamed protein product [Cuscuta campestris]